MLAEANAAVPRAIVLTKPSNKLTFDDAGWPSRSPSGLTNDTAGKPQLLAVQLWVSVVEVGGILESHLPRIGSAIVRCRGQGRSAVFVAAGIGFAAEIEHVEQIADGRAVHRDIGIVSVWMRVRQIIAAAAG
jgi:hypothetical protein